MEANYVFIKITIWHTNLTEKLSFTILIELRNLNEYTFYYEKTYSNMFFRRLD